MPTRAEFAASIKAKYPAYRSVPDDKLVDAMLTKFPAYRSKIQDYQTDEGTRGAITRAIARQAGGIVPPQSNEEVESHPIARNVLSGMSSAAHPAPNPEGNRFVELAKTVSPYLLATPSPGEIGTGNLLRGYKRVLEGGARDAAGGSALASPLRFVRGAAREFGKDSMISPASSHDINIAGTIGNEAPPPSGVTVMPKTPDVLDRMMATRKQPIRPTGIIRQGARTQDTLDSRIAGEQGRFSNTAMEGDQVQSILDELRKTDAPESTTLPPEATTTAAGPLKQSGKFPKSGQKGQPGGYTSGRPSISEKDQDALLEQLGGRGGNAPGTNSPPGGAGASPPVETASPARDYFKDIEPKSEDWHSGAEPGSPAARRAQSAHTYEREMNQGYRRRLEDPLSSILLGAILGGGSANRLMSSHGEGK